MKLILFLTALFTFLTLMITPTASASTSLQDHFRFVAENTTNLLVNDFEATLHDTTLSSITSENNLIESDTTHIALYLPYLNAFQFDYQGMQSHIQFNTTHDVITYDLQDLHDFRYEHFSLVEVPNDTQSFTITLIADAEEHRLDPDGFLLTVMNSAEPLVFDIHVMFDEAKLFNSEHYYASGYDEGYTNAYEEFDSSHYYELGYEAGLQEASEDFDKTFQLGYESVNTNEYYMQGYDDAINALDPSPPHDQEIITDDGSFDFDTITDLLTSWWWVIAIGSLFIIGTTKK